MSTTISFINIIAPGALTGCIARVNRDNNHTRKSSLVRNVLSKLVEGPTMQSGALTASKPYSITDALKVFKSDALIECLCSRHYAFADYVSYHSP